MGYAAALGIVLVGFVLGIGLFQVRLLTRGSTR
jgi:ABC-type sugar transport system permease subunit